jgi:hypothetical protein
MHRVTRLHRTRKQYPELNIQLILHDTKYVKLCVAYAEWDTAAQSFNFIDFYYQNYTSKTGYFCEVFSLFTIALSRYVENRSQFEMAGFNVAIDTPLSVSWANICTNDPILKESKRKLIFSSIRKALKEHELIFVDNALIITLVV